jgi:hypothetical protein
VTRARIVSVIGLVAVVTVLVLVTDASVWQILVAVLVGAAILRLGYAMISGLAQPVPEPPDPGELRKVKLVYRCSICGTEVRMTAAVAQEPEPPRHCMEDMDLLTPVE